MSHNHFGITFDEESLSSSCNDDPIMNLDGVIIHDEDAHGDEEPSDGESIGSSAEDAKDAEKEKRAREDEDDDGEYESDFVVPDDAPLEYSHRRLRKRQTKEKK